MMRTGAVFAASLLPALLALGGAGCSSSDSSTCCDTIRGSGVIAQEERVVGGFTGVTMASIGTLHIEQSGVEALQIEAEDNLLPYIRTSVNGGVLEITTAPGVDLVPSLPVEYRLQVVSLDRLLLSGVGQVESSGLDATSLSLTHAGVGSFDLAGLVATDLEVSATGVGNVRLAGAVHTQTVTLTGVGDYGDEDLASVDANVTITGVGSATVRASGTLAVTITGSGWVYYYGNPVVASSITGTGGVERKGS